MSYKSFVLTAVALCVIASGASAATLTAVPDENVWVGFSGGSDNWGNRSGDTKLEAQGGISMNNRQSRMLMRWDLSSLSGMIINSAVLRFQGVSQVDGQTTGTAEVREIVPGNPWVEATCSWTYYDGDVTSGGTGWSGGVGGPTDTTHWSYGIGDALGTTAYGGAWDYHQAAPFDIDIKALVAQWAAGTLDNNGLVVQQSSGVDGATNYITVDRPTAGGGDDTTCPILIVDWDVPEPGTLLVLCLGAMGLAAARRK